MSPRSSAALVLAAGLLVAPARAGEPEWRREVEKQLDRRVTFELVDTPLGEALEFFSTLMKVGMRLDPREAKRAGTPVSLKVSDMELRVSLGWILELGGLDYVLRDGGIFISTPERLDKRLAVHAPEPGWASAVRRGLERKLTFDFKQTPLSEALERIRTLTRVNFVIDPGARVGELKVELGVEDVPAGECLEIMVRRAGLDYMLLDGAVFVTTPLAATMLRQRGADTRPYEPEWVTGLKRQLDEKMVTFELRSKPLPEAVAFLRRKAGVNIVLDPAAKGAGKITVSTKVDQKSLGLALDRILTIAGYGMTMKDGMVFVSTPGRIADILDEGRRPGGWKGMILARMERNVSFEFVDTPVGEALAFLQALTHVNIVVDPAPLRDRARRRTICLKVADMELRHALSWILRLSGRSYTLRNRAVFVSTPERIRLGPRAAAGRPGRGR